MQICRRNCKPLIAVFSLIVTSKALCAPFLPLSLREGPQPRLCCHTLTSPVKYGWPKTKPRGEKVGWGACPSRGLSSLWWVPQEGSLHRGWGGRDDLQGIVYEHVDLENTNLLPAPSSQSVMLKKPIIALQKKLSWEIWKYCSSWDAFSQSLVSEI